MEGAGSERGKEKRSGAREQGRKEGGKRDGGERGINRRRRGDKVLGGDFLTDHKSVWRLEVKRQGMDLTSYSLSLKNEHKMTNSDDILSQQILVKQLRV